MWPRWPGKLVWLEPLNSVLVAREFRRRQLGLTAIDIPPFGLDPGIVPAINAARAAGFTTLVSCSGHTPGFWRDLRVSVVLGRWTSDHQRKEAHLAVDATAAKLQQVEEIVSELDQQGLATSIELLPERLPRNSFYQAQRGHLCLFIREVVDNALSLGAAETRTRRWRAALEAAFTSRRSGLLSATADRSSDKESALVALQHRVGDLSRAAGKSSYAYGLTVVFRRGNWNLELERVAYTEAESEALFAEISTPPYPPLEAAARRYGRRYRVRASHADLGAAIGSLQDRLQQCADPFT